MKPLQMPVSEHVVPSWWLCLGGYGSFERWNLAEVTGPGICDFIFLIAEPCLCVPTPPTRYLSVNADYLANFFLLFLSVARLIKNPDTANGVYLKIRKAKQSRY